MTNATKTNALNTKQIVTSTDDVPNSTELAVCYYIGSRTVNNKKASDAFYVLAEPIKWYALDGDKEKAAAALFEEQRRLLIKAKYASLPTGASVPADQYDAAAVVASVLAVGTGTKRKLSADSIAEWFPTCQALVAMLAQVAAARNLDDEKAEKLADAVLAKLTAIAGNPKWSDAEVTVLQKQLSQAGLTKDSDNWIERGIMNRLASMLAPKQDSVTMADLFGA
jgi:hypothetical protein